jgi:ferritin
LAKQIEEAREFFIAEERKLVAKFNAEILDNGGLKFSNGEDQMQFLAEHDALMTTQIESLNAITMDIKDFGEVDFTPRDLMSLEGVVEIAVG